MSERKSVAPKDPETVATPEGDGEDAGSAPEGLQKPPGSAPNPYDSDKHKPRGIEKFIDEIERGEYM